MLNKTIIYILDKQDIVAMSFISGITTMCVNYAVYNLGH